MAGAEQSLATCPSSDRCRAFPSLDNGWASIPAAHHRDGAPDRGVPRRPASYKVRQQILCTKLPARPPHRQLCLVIRGNGLVTERINILCNSSQTPNGTNATDQVKISSALYDEATGGGEVNLNDQEQDGILRTTARAIWGKLRPYVGRDAPDDFGERLVVCGEAGSLLNFLLLSVITDLFYFGISLIVFHF